VYDYGRASIDEQGREGVSLAAQRTKVDAYCVVKDWRVAGMIEDVGESAKHLRRPGVQALIALVSLQENLNATTATGRLMMSLLASVCKE
jgi:DNA invertase Pin-like site-specific DNA recombinase